MPELPEVESIRRQLVGPLTGRTILRASWQHHPAARIGGLDLAAGRTIGAVDRRGKYLLVRLDADPIEDVLELVLHLGMSGSLRVTPSDRSLQDRHDRVAFDLDDTSTLRFRDPRRFGRATIVPAGRYAPAVPTLASLGPEPLTDAFDPVVFARDLARTRSPVKAVLLGQRAVAGIGNIYADEALWRARIHPASRRVGQIRAHRLHEAIRGVLEAAIEREGTTFRDYRMVNGSSGRYAAFLDVYGKAGAPCRRCGTNLRRTTVAQRTSTFCPRCQR